MNIVKENINFKRGQDSKSALDIGMTTERYFDFIISELSKYNFHIDYNAGFSDKSLFIPFSHLNSSKGFKILYNKRLYKWSFKNDKNILLKEKINDFNSFWKDVKKYFGKYYENRISDLKKEISDYQYSLDKLEILKHELLITKL